MQKAIVVLTFFSLFTLFVVPVQCIGDTIYNNLGPGLSYTSGGLVVGSFPPDVFDVAAPFSVPVGPAFNPTEINISLTSLSGPNSFIVRLMNDAAGHPGSLISSWSLNNVPSFLGTTTIQPSQIIFGITGVTLQSNTQYWLGAFPGTPSSEGAWNFVLGFGQVASSKDDGNTWTVFTGASIPGFRVVGDAVPEPGTVMLVSIGLTALLIVQRKRTGS